MEDKEIICCKDCYHWRKDKFEDGSVGFCRKGFSGHTKENDGCTMGKLEVSLHTEDLEL